MANDNDNTNDNDQFRPVTFEKDLERILNELSTKALVLSGFTSDDQQVLLAVRRVDGKMVTLEAAAPVKRPFKDGETLDILFGLADGQYLLRTKIERVDHGHPVVAYGPELYRLQRRNNFRASVPHDAKMRFDLSKHNTTTVTGVQLIVMDISAGGARLHWYAPNLAAPKMGDQVAGLLVTPGQKQLELFGSVQMVKVSDGETQVGVAFQSLSLKDEQTLLFICMQMQRRQAPIKV